MGTAGTSAANSPALSDCCLSPGTGPHSTPAEDRQRKAEFRPEVTDWRSQTLQTHRLISDLWVVHAERLDFV